MPLSPKHVRSARQTPAAPDRAPQEFREWSRDRPDPAPQGGRPMASSTVTIDLSHPLVKVGAALFIGYTLGRLVHRHA